MKSPLFNRLGGAVNIPDEVLEAIQKDWDNEEKIRGYI